MDLNTITNIIGSLGFPIFMCLYLMNYQQKSLDLLKGSIDNLSDMIKELRLKLELLEGKDK